jgi:hypothetical protein
VLMRSNCNNVITDCVGHNPSPVSGFPNEKVGAEQLVSVRARGASRTLDENAGRSGSQFWQRP